MRGVSMQDTLFRYLDFVHIWINKSMLYVCVIYSELCVCVPKNNKQYDWIFTGQCILIK